MTLTQSWNLYIDKDFFASEKLQMNWPCSLHYRLDVKFNKAATSFCVLGCSMMCKDSKHSETCIHYNKM